MAIIAAMTPRDVIDHFVTQTATAEALGIAQSSVAGWVAAGRVPIGRQYQIELATGGALKAEKPPAVVKEPSPASPEPSEAAHG